MAARKEPQVNFEEALLEARNRGDAKDVLEALLDMARLYSTCDLQSEAIRCYEEILKFNETKSLLSPEEVNGILISLGTSCLRKGELRKAFSICEGLLADAGDKDPKLLVKACILASWTQLSLGSVERAKDFKDRAEGFLNELDDNELRTEVLLISGSVAMRDGRWAEAQELFEEALWMARKYGFGNLLADAHNDLGLIWKNKCSWARAREHLETALSLDREAGNYFKVATRATNLGVVLLKSGKWRQAEKTLEESLAANRKINRIPGIVRSLIALGNAKRFLGFSGETESLYLEALSLSQSSGLLREECLAKEFLGELLFERTDHERALDLLSQALTDAERTAPNGDMIAEIERRRAEVLVALGKDSEAEASAKRAIDCSRRLGDKYEEGSGLRVLGEIEVRRGRVDEARRLFDLSIETLRGADEKFELAKSCFSLGKLLCGTGATRKDGRKQLLTSLALFEELGAQGHSEKVEEELLSLKDVALQNPAERRKEKDSRRSKPIIRWGMVTGGDSLREVFSFVEKAAMVPFPVLIEGETGTGKELVARAIHSHGRRSTGRLLARNCTALPGNLFESELFGHAKGAFTGANLDKTGLFEESDNGTFFLDEIGDLPLEIQVKLLRVLEDGEITRVGETRPRKVDVRIIAATSKDLDEEVRHGRFRAELFYRLSALRIKLPPVRQRKTDIPCLVDYFLEKYSRMLEMDKPLLSQNTMNLFLRYDWPGNVRELENIVKRIVTLSSPGVDNFHSDLLKEVGNPSAGGNGGDSLKPLRFVVRKVEIGEIGKVLAMANGNKTMTARILGIDRKTLRKRLVGAETQDASSGSEIHGPNFPPVA
ncbi:MAG: sigma 54-interacting transcriptional regulator [Candidatus Eisenbacteria bacterium]|nr:sigma 54-interacting transcriptional regulator [Candidatus Eisenbacteria bacterium]